VAAGERGGGWGVERGVPCGEGGFWRRDYGGGDPASDQDPAAAGTGGAVAPSVRQGRGRC
jgi:hypothetical protein